MRVPRGIKDVAELVGEGVLVALELVVTAQVDPPMLTMRKGEEPNATFVDILVPVKMVVPVLCILLELLVETVRVEV